jgi:Lon protease-like protein
MLKPCSLESVFVVIARPSSRLLLSWCVSVAVTQGGQRPGDVAAHRAGIRTVILPQENERDLEEIPSHVREEMTFHFVAHCDEVLKLALLESGAVPAGVA